MKKNYLSTAIPAAIEAGNKILEVYHTDFNVEHKADDSPLTLADKRSHEVIKKALVPFGLPFLSEEGRDIPYEERKAWPIFWMVDPLDGTKEFIKRNDEFTVNIALIENNRPTLGVILVPVTGVIYFSADDLGAYTCNIKDLDAAVLNDIDRLITASRKMPLTPRPAEFTKDRPYTIMGSRSHATADLAAYVEKKKTEYAHVDFISAGSSLKLCQVAEGKADIYPRLGPTMEWDTAAGQAIVEASSLTVTEYDTGKPLSYNKENLLNPWFIVE